MKMLEKMKTTGGMIVTFLSAVAIICSGIIYMLSNIVVKDAYAMDRSAVQEQIVETNEKMDCGFNDFIVSGIKRDMRELRMEYGRNLERAGDDGWIRAEYDELKSDLEKHEKIQGWCIENGVAIKSK